MTKEQLLAAGLTEEQADSVLAMRGSELTNLRNQISDLTQQNTQLQADSAELATLKQQNLTAEQLQQQAIDEANAEKEKYQKMANKLEVEKVLITAGMQEDDYKDFIDGIVTSDKDVSVSVATAMATTFKTKMAAAEAQAKNDQLKNTPRPDGGDGSNGETKPKDVQLAEQLAQTANTQGGFTAYLKGE